YGEDLAEERLRLVPDLAAPAAGAALRRLRARLGAGAFALGARLETLDPYRFGGPGGNFGERELQADPDVVPAPSIPALAAAEETLERSSPPAAPPPPPPPPPPDPPHTPQPPLRGARVQRRRPPPP